MSESSILFLNRVYAPDSGATGRLLKDLAEAFASSGWRVAVIAAGEKALNSDEDGVEIRRVKSDAAQKPINYMLVWLKLLYAGLKAERPDIVVSLSDPPMLHVAGWLLAKKHKAKRLHWSHDVYPALFPALGIRLPRTAHSLLRYLSNFSLRRSAGVVVIGRCMARYLASTVGRHRVSFIPNWADHGIAMGAADGVVPSGSAADVGNIKSEAEPRFRVLYAGSIGRAHVIAPVLEAADILQRSNPEIEFLFVGSGIGHQRLHAARLRWGLENIRLLPPQPENALRRIMESGDLHLVTMKGEVSGMLVPSKFYSALAANRPCLFIGPQDCEIAEIVNEYACGEVVPAETNGRHLAQKILSYRMDQEKWLAAQNGAIRAGAEFNGQASIEAWLTRAETLVNEHDG